MSPSPLTVEATKSEHIAVAYWPLALDRLKLRDATQRCKKFLLHGMQMGVRSGRSRLDAADLMDPSARHTKARRAEEASLDASLDGSLESSNDISSTSDDEDACSTGTDLSLMSETEVRPLIASSLGHPLLCW